MSKNRNHMTYMSNINEEINKLWEFEAQMDHNWCDIKKWYVVYVTFL